MALHGKVGIAPGTTTLRIGPGGSISLAGSGLGSSERYFDARPTDFDMSKVYGYTPRRRGWLYGWPEVAQGSPCCASCGDDGPCDSQLGQDEAVATIPGGGPSLSPAQQAAISQFVLNQLSLEEKTLELKERRSRRFWGAIAGIATGTTALIAVLSYLKK